MQDAGIECRKILAVVILIVCLIIFTAFKFNPITQMNSRLWVTDPDDRALYENQVMLRSRASNSSIRIELLLHQQSLNITSTIRTLLKAIPGYDTSNSHGQATWVTALYDIGRHDRPFYEYRKWFTETLKIPLPVIVFCKSVDAQWISNARGSHLETLIITESQIPLEDIVDTVKAILPSMRRGRGSVEWVNERYIPTQFSKAVWMQRAIELNPFKSDAFFWVDAGVSRFFTRGQPDAPFALLQATQLEPDRLYISGTDNLHLLDTMPSNSMIGSQLNFVMGGVFGGRVGPVTRVTSALLHVLYETMLSKRRIDNEQVALGLIYKAHKDWFHVLDREALLCNVVCL